MKAVGSSEILVAIYKLTLHAVPKESNHHSHGPKITCTMWPTVYRCVFFL
jgi:hypothetical protein